MSNRLPPTLKVIKFGPFFVNVKGAIHPCVVCSVPTCFRVPFNQKVAKALFARSSGQSYMSQTKSYICSVNCLKAQISEKLFSLSIKPTPEVEDFLLNAKDSGVTFKYTQTKLKNNIIENHVTSIYQLDHNNFLVIKAYKYLNPGYNWRGDVAIMDMENFLAYREGITSLQIG